LETRENNKKLRGKNGAPTPGEEYSWEKENSRQKHPLYKKGDDVFKKKFS